MFFLYKKLLRYIKSNKYTYNPQRYYYESYIKKYKRLAGYYDLMELLTSKEELRTNEVITLMRGHAFDIKRENLFRKYKKPWSEFRIKILSITIDILIFKISLGGNPTHLEIHMTEGVVFYFKYCFSEYISYDDKHLIIEIIQDKYLDGREMSIDKNNIIDSSGTVLQIEDDVNFNIYYCNLNSIVFQRLRLHRKNYDKRMSKYEGKKVENLRKKL